MLFKVISVYAGWIEVDLNRQCILTNSDYLGCDAPKLLLDALCQLGTQKEGIRWLCWQDEPGASILKLEKDNQRLNIEVFDTELCAMDMEFEGESLGELTDEVIYWTTEDFYEVAKNVLEEFSLYENGNGNEMYCREWGTFPQAEYAQLKSLVKKFDNAGR